MPSYRLILFVNNSEETVTIIFFICQNNEGTGIVQLYRFCIERRQPGKTDILPYAVEREWMPAHHGTGQGLIYYLLQLLLYIFYTMLQVCTHTMLCQHFIVTSIAKYKTAILKLVSCH